MTDLARKTLIRDTFNTVATGYDKPALRYFVERAALGAVLGFARGWAGVGGDALITALKLRSEHAANHRS